MYTLMRSNIDFRKRELLLDLYSKKLAIVLTDLLHELTFKELDLNSWDILIQQFITNDWK